MLMPKRVKYRKKQRGKMKGNAQRGNSLAFGTFGLKAMESGWITSRQIEATRIAMTRPSRVHHYQALSSHHRRPGHRYSREGR